MAASMPALAQEFAQICKGRGIALDFLPRTLPLVDRYLQSAKGADGSDFMKTASLITAYLGEVIRRETGGAWREFDDTPMVDVGSHWADPTLAVMQLLEGGRAQIGEESFANTKAFCDWTCRHQRQWLDAAVLGSHASMADLRTAMSGDAKTAGWLVAHAQHAVLVAQLEAGEELAFTQDSLSTVERLLAGVHRMAASLSPDELTAAVNVWGVYLGEVIRRYFGGKWTAHEDGTIDLTVGNTKVDPIGKVRKRIVDGAAENVAYFYSSINKMLA
jgi:hypothetical protein